MKFFKFIKKYHETILGWIGLLILVGCFILPFVIALTKALWQWALGGGII